MGHKPHKLDDLGVRVLARLTRPWGVAVLVAVTVAGIALVTRVMAPWFPTGAVVHIAVPFVCRFAAGAVFVVVLFNLIEHRDPGAGRWCVGVLAVGLMPLLFMDAFALSMGVTWAELIAWKWADPDPFVIEIIPAALGVLGGITPFVLQRTNQQIRKALESRE